ncbi:MAG: SMC-Scp complex subunit ScpB [Balneolaceae bacterium]
MIDYQFVDGTRLISVIEALIFSSPDPISWDHLAGIVVEGEDELKLTEETIRQVVDQLNRRYDENGLAFRIEEVGGGFTFVTQPRFHPWLSIFQHENAYRKLSQSAIETLAIVAYRQPITKPEVDQIRGVDSGYILRQLLEKMLVRVSGRADSPGKPLLYKTTDHFLKHFGINSVDELPRPREIEEILKDDDMAEHRQLLMERQMELEEEDADDLLDEFLEKRNRPDVESVVDQGETPDENPQTEIDLDEEESGPETTEEMNRAEHEERSDTESDSGEKPE